MRPVVTPSNWNQNRNRAMSIVTMLHVQVTDPKGLPSWQPFPNTARAMAKDVTILLSLNGVNNWKRMPI